MESKYIKRLELLHLENLMEEKSVFPDFGFDQMNECSYNGLEGWDLI